MSVPNYVLVVEIPALESLIVYLRERDSTQAKLSAAATAVALVTERLKEANHELQLAVASGVLGSGVSK